MDEQMKQNRAFLKCPDMGAMRENQTHQRQGLQQPPLEKVIGGEVIELPGFEDILVNPGYFDLLDKRRSERVFSDVPVTQQQLAFMLWSTQGVQSIRGERYAGLRPVPSGGARHPFELYIMVKNVGGLEPGLYHYLPFNHVGEKLCAIEFVAAIAEFDETLEKMLVGQKWGIKAAFTLFFTCLPYRAEWRYSVSAHRVILIDLGHAGQNVMLSATALGLGSCCLAAFDNVICDEVFGIDGENEYTVYAIPVGAL